MLAPTGRRTVASGSDVASARDRADPAADPPAAEQPAADQRGAARRRPDAGAVLHINWTACDGRGLCTELLPDLLQRDDWGYPLALGYGSNIPLPGHLTGAAADAVALCPRQALTLSRTVRQESSRRPDAG